MATPTVREQFKNWDTVRLELEQVVARIDPATFEWKPVENKNVRSIGDIVRHLCDAESYWIDRVIEGKDWIRHTRELYADHESIQERWKVLRARTLTYLDSLSPTRLTDTKVDHRGNIVTIGWIVWYVFQHEAHHRGQIYMLLRLRKPDRASLVD